MKMSLMDSGRAVTFDTPEKVDVDVALEMIRVGIVPTSEVSPVGHIQQLHGDIPVRSLGERTRAQFLEAIKAAGLPAEKFAECPAAYKFEAIEAVHGK